MSEGETLGNQRIRAASCCIVASLDAIHAYFQELYWSKGDAALDAKQILQRCAERRSSRKR